MQDHRAEELDEGIRELSQAELNAVSGAGFIDSMVEWMVDNSLMYARNGKQPDNAFLGIRG